MTYNSPNNYFINKMDFILFGDLFCNHITSYLSCVNLYNLCKTNKQYKQILNKGYFERATITEIKKRISSTGSKETFTSYLEATKELNTSISGSFIIQCILGEEWPNISTDYYINAEAVPNMMPPWERSLDFSDYYHASKSIGNCNIYTLKDQNTDTFIKTIFDFDICKNIYWYDGADHIYIKSINQILSKKAVFSCKSHLTSSIERRQKYINRGFTFEMAIPFEELVKNIINLKMCKIKECHEKKYLFLKPYQFQRCMNMNYEFVEGDDIEITGLNQQPLMDCDNNCILKLYNDNTKHFHGGVVNDEILFLVI